jgi:uncharacterized membrane protein YagU involved in acid resistance
MIRTIGLATLVAGTLDIIFAIALTLLYGRDPMAMLRYVGSGPYPPAADMGTAGAVIGLAVHFTLMAIMAGLYIWFARSRHYLSEMWVRAGIAYGIITYIVMNLIVVPLRFGAPVSVRPVSIATQFFAHVLLVGIPIAFIAARHFRARGAAR